MAVWKKLNPETGEYEEIANAGTSDGGISLKDTVGIEDAYTIYPMADIADGTSVGTVMTTYTLTGLIAGDTITTKRQYNGQFNIIGDGNGNDLTSSIAWSSYVYGTFVLDKDYETLKVQCQNGYESYATVATRVDSEKKRPSFNDEFVPTISDDETSTLKTMSSAKIYELYGYSIEKAKAALSGKVWIAMGDSYTKGMNGVLQTIADRYGMILDNRGIVSSTICGDTTGSKGSNPMWNRTNGAASDYTSEGGYTIDDVPYTADDVGLITFMGGANDGYGISTWIGTGKADTDTNHIYGAMNSIYNAFGENFPNAKIITITQPAHYNYTINTEIDDETAQILGFADAAAYLVMSDVQLSNYAMAMKADVVREMARMYESHIVDAFSKFPTIFSPTNRSTYWQSDKLHLTATGYQLVADLLEVDGILAIFGK